MDRLKKKGLLDWKIDETDIARSGHPRRHFTLTGEGVTLLREARSTLLSFWEAAGKALAEG
jgi:DNA-binding PadR family transcriptional regulator